MGVFDALSRLLKQSILVVSRLDTEYHVAIGRTLALADGPGV